MNRARTMGFQSNSSPRASVWKASTHGSKRMEPTSAIPRPSSPFTTSVGRVFQPIGGAAMLRQRPWLVSRRLNFHFDDRKQWSGRSTLLKTVYGRAMTPPASVTQWPCGTRLSATPERSHHGTKRCNWSVAVVATAQCPLPTS